MLKIVTLSSATDRRNHVFGKTVSEFYAHYKCYDHAYFRNGIDR